MSTCRKRGKWWLRMLLLFQSTPFPRVVVWFIYIYIYRFLIYIFLQGIKHAHSSGVASKGAEDWEVGKEAEVLHPKLGFRKQNNSAHHPGLVGDVQVERTGWVVEGEGASTPSVVYYVIWCGASSISMRKVSMGVSPMSLKKNKCSRHLRPMERRAGNRSNSFANLSRHKTKIRRETRDKQSELCIWHEGGGLRRRRSSYHTLSPSHLYLTFHTEIKRWTWDETILCYFIYLFSKPSLSLQVLTNGDVSQRLLFWCSFISAFSMHLSSAARCWFAFHTGCF